eukprot:m.106181 g.106181  ORF g.106181 m.106181 type:complete len:368 (-) comp18981_c0_seq2:111-1214(-)
MFDARKFLQAGFAVVGIVGAAPVYALGWLGVRALTLPLPGRVYRALDDLLYSEYQEYIRLFFQGCTGVEFVFHGDIPAERESVLYISNHQCTVDWFVINVLAAPLQAIGRIRYVLKDTLRLLPLYGWYFEQHGCVYVSKNWTVDAVFLTEALGQFRRNAVPVWLVLFPEGTRFDPFNSAILQRHQSYCEEKGLAPTKHVLVPRTKGFESCVQHLRGHATHLYDITIAYTRIGLPGRPPAPSMADLMTQRYPRVDAHVSRVALDDLPQDAEGLGKWLLERFAQKDKLLEDFYAGKGFPGQEVCVRSGVCSSILRAMAWTCVLFPFFGTKLGRRVYMGTWVVAGGGGVLAMLAVKKYKAVRARRLSVAL